MAGSAPPSTTWTGASTRPATRWKAAGRDIRTRAAGASRWRRAGSARTSPGSAWGSRKPAANTGSSRRRASRGSAGATSTTRTTRPGCRAAVQRATGAPHELPTSVTGPRSSRSTTRARWSAIDGRSTRRRCRGVRPKPGRSGATTRRPAARPGPTSTQFAAEPSSPCTSTMADRWLRVGPPKSSTCTGPSMSTMVWSNAVAVMPRVRHRRTPGGPGPVGPGRSHPADGSSVESGSA